MKGLTDEEMRTVIEELADEIIALSDTEHNCRGRARGTTCSAQIGTGCGAQMGTAYSAQ